MKYKVFFGDIHIHSGFSDCFWRDRKKYGALDRIYRFARYRAKLDFVSITDHDFTLQREEWEKILEKSYQYNKIGNFITLPGYEWTSYAYGHRNIYFLKEEESYLISCVPYSSNPLKEKGITPEELFNKLKKRNTKFLSIPHHPSLTQFPVNWDFYNSTFEPVMEITSLWGNFEYFNNPFQSPNSDNLPGFFAHDVLKKGYRLGFVGGSDGHDGNPGLPLKTSNLKQIYEKKPRMNSLSKGIPKYFIVNPLGSGFTGIWCEELTRENIFSAISRRRTFATTGVKIKLKFQVNGYWMGEEIFLKKGEKPEIFIDISAPDVIKKIEIIKNNKVIKRFFPEKKRKTHLWVDNTDCIVPFTWYYVKVTLKNEKLGWSSPIWINYKKKREQSKFHFIFQSHSNLRIKKPAMVIQKEKSKDGGILIKIKFLSEIFFNFKGGLEIDGFRNYFVRPYNFAIVKYGGDLFTDDGKGKIKWDVTPSSFLNPLDKSEEKGLEMVITPRGKKISLNFFVKTKRENIYIGKNYITERIFKITL